MCVLLKTTESSSSSLKRCKPKNDEKKITEIQEQPEFGDEGGETQSSENLVEHKFVSL